MSFSCRPPPPHLCLFLRPCFLSLIRDRLHSFVLCCFRLSVLMCRHLRSPWFPTTGKSLFFFICLTLSAFFLLLLLLSLSPPQQSLASLEAPRLRISAPLPLSPSDSPSSSSSLPLAFVHHLIVLKTQQWRIPSLDASASWGGFTRLNESV